VFFGLRKLVYRLVLGDHMLFLLGLDVRMSRYGHRSEDIFLEEALFYTLLQVLLEGPKVDGLVSIAFVIRAVFLRLGERRIVL